MDRKEIDYQTINRKVMDERVRAGWRWGLPYDHETFVDIVEGRQSLRLTPTRDIPESWLSDVRGLRILGLASGGGQQMPVLSKLGADVVSLDISEEMLSSDSLVAERENLKLRTLRYDITKSLPFADSSFDMVFMPVCLCYIREITPIFNEIRRVLKKGGVLLTGQDNGMNYLLDEDGEFTGHFPYDPIMDESQMKECMEGGSGIQFSHTEGEIMKAIIDAGLVIEDIYEDTDGEGTLHDRKIPSFVAIKASRR